MDKKNENVDYYIQKTEGIMLSDVDIKRALDEKLIEVSPLDEAYIQPSSIDLRVGSEFRVFENHKYSHIDPKADQDDLTTLVTATIEEPFVLHPGEFVLGTTFERVTLSNKVVARLEGKSSLGRIGLLIHSTAGSVSYTHLTLPTNREV